MNKYKSMDLINVERGLGGGGYFFHHYIIVIKETLTPF